MSGVDKTRDELFSEYFEDREGSAQVAEHAYRQGWKDRATYTVVPIAPTQGADARPVAIYQGRVVGDTRWDDLSKDAHDHMQNKPQIFETRIVYATRDAALSLPHDAWKAPFDERHEFDVYPDHFMTGLRNEFAAGWHAAIKAIAAIAPREET